MFGFVDRRDRDSSGSTNSSPPGLLSGCLIHPSMPPKERHQTSISKFFKPPAPPSSSPNGISTSRKRPGSPIDLTLDDDDELPAASSSGTQSQARLTKKPRPSEPTFANSPSTLSVATREPKPRVFDVSSSAPEISVTKPKPIHETTRARDARRKWALGSTSQFEGSSEENELRIERRKAYSAKLSLNLIAREARARKLEEGEGVQIDGDVDEVGAQEHDVDADAMDVDMEEDDDDSPKPSSSKLKGAKGASGSAGKAASKRKTKSKPEVGPSGKTYTPLEKQVRPELCEPTHSLGPNHLHPTRFSI